MEKLVKRKHLFKMLKLFGIVAISSITCGIICFDVSNLNNVKLTEDVIALSCFYFNPIGLCMTVLIISGIYIFFFQNLRKQKLDKGLIILSILFSVVETVSLMFYYFHSFIYSFINLKIVVYCLVAVIAYAALFYAVTSNLFKVFSKLKIRNKRNYWDNNIGVISFVTILVGWIPWMLIFYPGSMWYDMCYQLEQYYGYASYNLHPIFATLIMGKCLDIGKVIFHSDDIGIFLYICLQSGICALVYSRVIVWINRHKLPTVIQVVSLCYFAFLPIFGSVSQYGVKDVMTYGLFTAFLLQTIICVEKIVMENEKISVFNYCIFFVISILCSLYRKEMIIICCFIFLIFLLFGVIRKQYKRAICFLFLCVMLVGMYKMFDVIMIKNISKSEIGRGYGSSEALSIPLQQVARFVYYHEDEVTGDEKEILNECFNYGYDGIRVNYNPYLSDPIKYKFQMGKEGFWNVYVSFLKKSPLTYLESAVANSFGYYSIIPPLPATVNNAPTNGTPGDRNLFYINRDPDIENNIVNISYSDGTVEARNKLVSWVNSWRERPVLCLFYSLGFYTWIVFGLVYWSLKNKKKWEELIIFLPTILIILVCIASPVNDCLRYFVSVIASLPSLVSWSYLLNQNMIRDN